MQINCIGQMFDSSGYANHFRGLVNELNKLIPCKIMTNLPPGWERDANDQELEMIKREQDYDINLIVTHPVNWRGNLSAKRNWVYLIWEGDRVPKWILEECLNDNIEKIIVPSQHTYDAVMNTNIDFPVNVPFKDKFIVIPHGVDLKTFHPITQPKYKDEKEQVIEPAFKFLANKGFRNLEDRGGIQYLIKAYLEEFSEKDNVELILKINPAYGVPNIEQMFPNMKNKDAPKITYITENYTKKQLNELYNECDVFVSPTRAEAFNLPCLEALAVGKPVITTNYGGQTDFCNSENSWLIGGKLTEVQHELEYEGIQWLTVDHEELKCTLRFTFENQQINKLMARCTVETAKKFTWTNTAKQIHSLR